MRAGVRARAGVGGLRDDGVRAGARAGVGGLRDDGVRARAGLGPA